MKNFRIYGFELPSIMPESSGLPDFELSGIVLDLPDFWIWTIWYCARLVGIVSETPTCPDYWNPGFIVEGFAFLALTAMHPDLDGSTSIVKCFASTMKTFASTVRGSASILKG